MGNARRSALVSYLKSKDAKAAAKGLDVLSSEPESFIPEFRTRLAYVETDFSIASMKAKAYTISHELQQVAAEIAG